MPLRAQKHLRELPLLVLGPICMEMDPDTTKVYTWGRCLAIVEHRDRWHMSVSHPERLPTLDEVLAIRQGALPDDIDVAVLLPSGKQRKKIDEGMMEVLTKVGMSEAKDVPFFALHVYEIRDFR